MGTTKLKSTTAVPRLDHIGRPAPRPMANGGQVPRAEIVEGPGTGTSDSIPAEVPPGTFIAPADTTQVLLSDGEAAFAPEVLQAIGAAVVDIMRSATHTPVEEQHPEVVDEEQEPLGFADGGLVEERKPNSFGDAAAASQDSTVKQIGAAPAPPAAIPDPAPAIAPPAPAAPAIDPNAGPLSRAAASVVAAAPVSAPAPAPVPAALGPADRLATSADAGAGRGFDMSGRTAGAPPAPFVRGTPQEQLAGVSAPGFDATGGTRLGFGVRRIDGGSSPLYTNLDGPNGAYDNASLMGRAPMSEQNAGAIARLADRHSQESIGRVLAGYAPATTYTNGPVAAGPDTGGFGILSKDYQAKRDASFNTPEQNKAINEMAKRALERERLANERRGQDFSREDAQGNLALGQQRLGFDVSNQGAIRRLAEQRFGFDVANAGQTEAGRNARAMLAAQADVEKARVTASGKRTAPEGYVWSADGNSLRFVPGGPQDPAVKQQLAGATAKAMPAGAANAMLENYRNHQRAVDAMALLNGQEVDGVKGDKNATGAFKGQLPNAMLQFFDPSGVSTRAAIADLGSLVVHDRSGAAVSAAEFPRLAPFIPSPSDDPASARKKLQQFERNYRSMNDDARQFYEDSGYRVPQLGARNNASAAPPAPSLDPGEPPPPSPPRQPGLGVPRRVASQQDVDKLPSGSRFMGPDGIVRIKP